MTDLDLNFEELDRGVARLVFKPSVHMDNTHALKALKLARKYGTDRCASPTWFEALDCYADFLSMDSEEIEVVLSQDVLYPFGPL